MEGITTTEGIITTIKQNCRRCYTCVRDCPAKAIRIEDGQASVVPDRCIGCGSCTMVCSQNAKAYTTGITKTLQLLDEGGSVAALVAPSFPAGFTVAPAQVIGAIHALGFDPVVEVAYGADLVNQACHDHLRKQPTGVHIASACPAVVEYVRKYHPHLTDRIMPIVSPMVATALAVKEQYGADVRCVFIGPCIAKKAEMLDEEVAGIVDEVLTLEELQSIFASRRVNPARAPERDFDPPHAGPARIYPIPGGLLESAGIGEGILDPRLIVVSGRAETLEALAGLPDDQDGQDDSTLLVEALMCKGCYAGPGIKSDEPGLLRRRRVTEFASTSLHRQETGALPAYPNLHTQLSLGRGYTAHDQRSVEPSEQEIRKILAHTNKFFPEDELNCGACGYATCRAKAAAVYAGMAEENMCLPFIIDQSERVCEELNVPWDDLRDVHRHLINTEKLASMGQMAAGVAHELNNPLSTILLYSHILQRKLSDREDVGDDLRLIAGESERCTRIISNLLDFARQSRVRVERIDLKDLIDTIVYNTVSHVSANTRQVEAVADVPPGLEADADRDQLTQVLLNLVKNGVEAMEGRTGTVRVKAREMPETDRIRFSVSDQGNGIPTGAEDKIFQPFFTTKSIGKGTGLGLPITYGIVKMHNGNMWFDSEKGVGTTFYVEIPKNRPSGERSPN
ncbi:MAG: [Fe-Fe] hydrogenase large subunit C-terminal domain-containing protein [Thermoleophilia bacterium]|jgi:two-component system NtrC family sensor kinase